MSLAEGTFRRSKAPGTKRWLGVSFACALIIIIAGITMGKILATHEDKIAPSNPGSLGGSWRSLGKVGPDRKPSIVEFAADRIVVDGVSRQAKFSIDADHIVVVSPGTFEGDYHIVDPNMATSSSTALLRVMK